MGTNKKHKVIGTSIHKSLVLLLDAEAKECGITRAAVTRQIILDYLKKQNAESPVA